MEIFIFLFNMVVPNIQSPIPTVNMKIGIGSDFLVYSKVKN